MKPLPLSLETTLAAPKLVVHEASCTISKLKPKIRIIHIVEPEIIKTDVENFRELVQRLTGKPVERKGATNKGNNASTQILQPRPRKKIGCIGVRPIFQDTQTMREVEEIHKGENPTAFLRFLADVDGSLHDMNEFPLLPNFMSSQINTFGEMPLC